MSNAKKIESNTFVFSYFENNPLSKKEKIIFALTIICSVAVVGMGVVGLGVQQKWWQVEFFADLGKARSIQWIIVGTVCALLTIYIVKKRSSTE